MRTIDTYLNTTPFHHRKQALQLGVQMLSITMPESFWGLILIAFVVQQTAKLLVSNSSGVGTLLLRWYRKYESSKGFLVTAFIEPAVLLGKMLDEFSGTKCLSPGLPTAQLVQ